MPAKTFKMLVVSISQQSALPVPISVSHEPILTGEQVAERLQLKTSTIYELTRRRNRRPLPAMRAGKFLRFKWSDVERWLDGEPRSCLKCALKLVGPPGLEPGTNRL